VILTTGSWQDRMLGAPGEELEGVEGCLAFLNAFYRGEVESLKEKVAVIGDGNAAFDLARTLKRIGADVTIVSWFPREMIPADPEEIKAAAEEGIAIRDRLQVAAFEGGDGQLETLRCQPTKPGEPDAAGIPWPVPIPGEKSVELPFRRAFVAIGQAGMYGENTLGSEIKATRHGFIAADDDARTNLAGVYAAGDAASGPSTVVQAMAAGRNAADAVMRDLFPDLREKMEAGSRPGRPGNRDFNEIPVDLPIRKRPAMPELGPAARKNNFSEVVLGFDEHQVA
ncbi:MAG: FAD-dependent oxidoreductase, partial [Desulfobacterales bacterium]|nr:FAD-dependent oxidoreductase [Desulfobacterales bacterium]